MKVIYTFFSFMFCLLALQSYAQERYVDEVFSGVDTEQGIIYGGNTTVLPALLGADPTIRPLNMNLITPAGDSLEDRPVIVLLHTGNFLPAFLNGNIHGTIDDPYLNDLGNRLARMGYVVAVADYRAGWNPISTSQEVRTNTLINAAYRGVQDVNTLARFLRKTVAGGNPYGISGEKITVWGVGTGGYVAYGAATLDEYFDVVLPKFIGADINGDGTPDPFVIEPIHGDPFALKVGINPANGDTLCFPNHTEPGLSSEFQLCVNMGGALGDLTWLDETDPPMISFHVPTDPFAPYQDGIVIVPTTGDLVVAVDGSYNASEKANDIGVNDVFIDGARIDDDYTTAANANNDGNEGLFPFVRQDWDVTNDSIDNAVPVEASPWEFWDETTFSTAPFGQATIADAGDVCEGIPIEFCNWHLIQLRTNPDMSLTKAKSYQDSIVGYFAPRACLALDLPCADSYRDVATEEFLPNTIVEISPNPASNNLYIKSGDEEIIDISLIDMNGRVAVSVKNINDNSFSFDRTGMESGMYILQVRLTKGLVTKKVMFK